ncbi:RNA ligase/cyclic nucleotide phosphodiesterase [Legionella quinlivanii]|uniref:RNA 2',3'-cyclic phosphodiesterase n=2 Tax=Legionella quinlivanii TaxID=45073 RepID=A0A0W0Y443_9GAMM|nr:RNA ligase/cyclic nucleotide phosphodiesterase [Legionella quinlivanii]SEG11557.1 2'-5' RNA ligase [Legionella quinlivanii DSM 21216]STY10170.1 RNA ligase/cyclic nucleotide phosphodiesterase [Legionella quinlivanii]
MIMESFRAFFGMEISGQAQEELALLISELKAHPSASSVKWTLKENLHVTLQFVQKMNCKDIPLLAKTLTAEFSCEPFPVQFGDFLYFPNLAHPKVISLKVEPNETLARLSRIIGEVLNHLGYATERRPYTAHVTLGRIRDNAWNRQFGEQVSLPVFTPMNVSEVTLFESQSISEGVRYIPVMKWPLLKGG